MGKDTLIHLKDKKGETLKLLLPIQIFE